MLIKLIDQVNENKEIKFACFEAGRHSFIIDIDNNKVLHMGNPTKDIVEVAINDYAEIVNGIPKEILINASLKKGSREIGMIAAFQAIKSYPNIDCDVEEINITTYTNLSEIIEQDSQSKVSKGILLNIGLDSLELSKITDVEVLHTIFEENKNAKSIEVVTEKSKTDRVIEFLEENKDTHNFVGVEIGNKLFIGDIENSYITCFDFEMKEDDEYLITSSRGCYSDAYTATCYRDKIKALLTMVTSYPGLTEDDLKRNMKFIPVESVKDLSHALNLFKLLTDDVDISNVNTIDELHTALESFVDVSEDDEYTDSHLVC